MTEDTTSKPNGVNGLEATGPPSLTPDLELFSKQLDDSDLTDAQKREFIEVLWSLVVSFVDLGLGIHPLQLVMANSCEQQAEITRFIAAETPHVINSSDCSNTEFNAAADGYQALTQERDSK